MGGKNAGSKAAEAQVEGIEKGIAEQRRQYNQSREDIAPFRFAGLVALRQMIGGELGLPYFGEVQYDPASGEINIGRTGTRVDAPAQRQTAAPGPSQEQRLAALNRDQMRWERSLGDNNAPGDPGVRQQRSEFERRRQAIMSAPAAPAPAPAPVSNLPQEPLESGFQATPGYQFRLDQGLQAVERSAAARGLLGSGRTLKALQEYGEGLASQEYGNYYNRLASLAGAGQTATGNLAALGQNNANSIAQGYSNAGAARAEGIRADANARASTFNNLVSLGTMAATGGFGGSGIFGGGSAGFGKVGTTVQGLPWLG